MEIDISDIPTEKKLIGTPKSYAKLFEQYRGSDAAVKAFRNELWSYTQFNFVEVMNPPIITEITKHNINYFMISMSFITVKREEKDILNKRLNR